MGKTWKLHEARDHLGEVVRRAAEDGPQTITVRGHERAVVLSAEHYRQLCEARGDETAGNRTGEWLIERFREGPLYGVDLHIERDKELIPPPVDLS